MKTKSTKASAAPSAQVLTVPIRNLQNETVGEANLPSDIFAVPFRRHIVWEAVKEIRAKDHAGTHKTKVRSEVSGTGKKPFKQKHTGRARQGGGRPPLHRHGGTVHGPVPRSYAVKMNVRTKKAALKCVLSEKVRNNAFVLLENLDLTTHKTADLAKVIAKLGVAGKALLVDRRDNVNLLRAASNNPQLLVLDPLGVNVYDAMNAHTLVLTEQALRAVAEVLA